MSLLDFLLCIVAGLVALPCLYLAGLTLLSAKAKAKPLCAPPLRFDILVPAHNEEAGIARTVENLLGQAWPKALFRVIVVADNCEDNTVSLAQTAGALVWQRHSETKRGKGHALEFAFQQSLEEGFAQAVVVVDADSLLSKNALQGFAARIGLGARAIQAHYGVLEVKSTWRTRLMRIAFAAFHGVRSSARERLGLSSGLRGNGMCFASGLIREVPHRAHSVVEDLEYGLLLGQVGCRVVYAGDIEVLGEMAGDEKAFRLQRQRWEGGRLSLAKTLALPLLWQGLRKRSPLLLDLALDLLLPPLSWPALATSLGLSLALLWHFTGGHSLAPAFVFSVGLLCLLLYVVRGWQLSGTGLRGLVDLAFAPWFVLWKLGLALAGNAQAPKTWVRTRREGETNAPTSAPPCGLSTAPLDNPSAAPPGSPPAFPGGWGGRGRVALWVLLACSLMVATALSAAEGNGNPKVALPLLACAVGVLLCLLPLRSSSLCLLFLVLVCDYLPERPFEGLWASPLAPLSRLLFLNLSTTMGIPFLRFSGVDAAVLLLLGVGVWRRVFRVEHVDPPGTPSVHPLNGLLLLQFATVVALDIWGVARGGNFNESLWQLRQLLLFPLMSFAFLHAIAGRTEDLRLIARVLVAAALAKAVVGMYFVYAVARPSGLEVEFTTSHSDTLLFVPVLAMAAALAYERPLLKRLWHLPLWTPLVALGMWHNDWRLAYVALGASLAVVLAMLPWSRLKRRTLQAAVLLAPLAMLYLAVGWQQNPFGTHPFWGPARLVKSLVRGDPRQAGADYRDMENFNLLFTWSENAFVPLGFGHRFEEPIALPDISFVMPAYAYHPHNSILWLWAIGGPLGFTALFLPVVTMVFLAARAYPLAKHPVDRTALLTALSFVTTYLLQCWGDMATLSYFGSLGLALSLAVISKLAMRTGAWPAPGKAT
jgi:hypothetical protein